MKKILLVGNGAREHVIGETLKKSTQDIELHIFGKAKNPGLAAIATSYTIGDIMNFDELIACAQNVQPDFAFVGPDDPIGAGAADALLTVGIKSVAPQKAPAQIESSKSFGRDLVKKYDIPGNPAFNVFTTAEGIADFLTELGDDYVVKADGLMGGKGVKVAGDHLHSHDEALDFAKLCLEKHGRVVVEEKLYGVEFSLMSFVDGEHVVDMPTVQDHKRAYDGDKGPNTGGMGSYSDANHLLPFLTEKDRSDAHAITVAVAQAIKEETGIPFKGILYGGFIATKDGVRLIEYNARFGDPEAMNVLPLLETDFVELCEAIINGTLHQCDVRFSNRATVCTYIVPKGYPENPVKGEKITISDIPEKALRYFSSVSEEHGGIIMSSSRAIAMVGIGDTIADAEEISRSAVGSVEGNVFYRTDIGTADLLQKRIDMMKELRD